MTARKRIEETNDKEELKGITSITVQGFKSLAEESSIEISPLTILAGANSSGKSSIMQPLLMLKQTLEASFDPGPLLINGDHVKFTSYKQFLSENTTEKEFTIAISYDENLEIKVIYSIENENTELKETIYKVKQYVFSIKRNADHNDLLNQLIEKKHYYKRFYEINESSYNLSVSRYRCFLEILSVAKHDDTKMTGLLSIFRNQFFSDILMHHLQDLIHVPGVRNSPERYYTRTAVETKFPGEFSKYIASIISHWQDSNHSRLADINDALKSLGLNSQVEAKALNQAQVELRVNRLSNGSKRKKDLVNIADVGFGVSQVLPVLVALRVAEPGQLVYIEQPELHLHPRAQMKMAEILADAARRGVRVVAETHSSLLLLGVQTLVAEGKLSPELVKLHWFQRQKNGVTKITSADLDENGAFGDWPEDFGETYLHAENSYLHAALK